MLAEQHGTIAPKGVASQLLVGGGAKGRLDRKTCPGQRETSNCFNQPDQSEKNQRLKNGITYFTALCHFKLARCGQILERRPTQMRSSRHRLKGRR